MTSTAVMLIIIPIIAVTILTAEITEEEDLSVLTSITAPRGLLYRCPSLISAEYEVTALNSVSALIPRCAYILYSSSILIQQSYHIGFGSKEVTGQDCQDPRLKFFRFNCLTKDLVLYNDTMEGLMLLRLFEDNYNKTGTPDYKCAMYETINGNRTSFRFAISPNTSCKGLINVLYPPQNMMFSDSNEGAMLLSFNIKKLDNVDYESFFSKRNRRHALPYKIDGNDGHGSVTNTTTANINKN